MRASVGDGPDRSDRRERGLRRRIGDDRAPHHVLGGLGRSGPEHDLDTALRPAARVACRDRAGVRRLATGGAKLFAPIPVNVVCTEIYGGPQRARVVGTVAASRIWATFTRTNGCQIDRWKRLSPWLLPPGGVTLAPAVSIGGRDDRPLRRRRTPSATRDRAGARARPPRRRGRPEPRGARASRRPTSPRSSTSWRSPRSWRSLAASASTAS